MDETTQQNAALVEEATAAARSMEEQAGHLAEAVSVFKLDESAAPVAQTARVRPIASRPVAVKGAAAEAASAGSGHRGAACHIPGRVGRRSLARVLIHRCHPQRPGTAGALCIWALHLR